MINGHSTTDRSPRKPVRVKPAKPYPDFPLRAHDTGYWCKKIRGRLHYFGRWEDPDAALRKYLEERDALQAGKSSRAHADALIVKDVANAFLSNKRDRVESGEITQRTWDDYKVACDLIVAAFGRQRRVADLGPDDFSRLRKRMAQRWGPVRLGNMVQNVRSVFKLAFDADMLDKPVRVGPSFRKPSKKVLRLHRAQKGKRLFTAEEVRQMCNAAGQPMKAMILLGINAGLGNTDCGRLPLSAIDLEAGWLDFPRPKTGVPRRCWLWPETIEAIREAITQRPEPADATSAGLLFITRKFRLGWGRDSSVTHEMSKLLKRVGINGNRGFYTLRHTFRTVADAAKDQPAADFIMGHARDDMASVYREQIGDDRLRAVSEHVRGWLLAGAAKQEPPGVIPFRPNG